MVRPSFLFALQYTQFMLQYGVGVGMVLVIWKGQMLIQYGSVCRTNLLEQMQLLSSIIAGLLCHSTFARTISSTFGSRQACKSFHSMLNKLQVVLVRNTSDKDRARNVMQMQG